MTNQDLCAVVWKQTKNPDIKSIHELNKIAAERVIRESLIQRSLDNVTTVIISFSALEEKFIPPPTHVRPNSKLENLRKNSKTLKTAESEFESMTSPLQNSTAHYKFSTMDERRYRSVVDKERIAKAEKAHPVRKSTTPSNFPKISFKHLTSPRM